METQQLTTVSHSLISPAQLLEHWQGHRKLTRKLIEGYPEDQIFNYSIGNMRPFAELIMEIIDLSGAGVQGIATGKWKMLNELSHVNGDHPQSKAEILNRWDFVTDQINAFWPQITLERFQENVMAFGAYEGTVYSTLLYVIDNEIHHRGQAYVYLRSLGVTPPPFWDRY